MHELEVKKEEKVVTEPKSETEVLIDLLRTRRSERRFTGDRIPDEHIERILDALRTAPSPENMQMWRYVVIREDQEMKKLLADTAQLISAAVFGSYPYEATTGRLWYLPSQNRAATYEEMKDGELFRYPEKADMVILGLGSESWHDAITTYPLHLFGSVVVAMGLMSAWLVAHSMGYGVAWQAFPLADQRIQELITDKLGIPRTWTPIGTLNIGVIEGGTAARRMLGPSRWPLEGVVFSERWGNPYIRLAFRKER